MPRHKRGQPTSEEVKRQNRQRYADLQSMKLKRIADWVPEEEVDNVERMLRVLRVRYGRLLPSERK